MPPYRGTGALTQQECPLSMRAALPILAVLSAMAAALSPMPATAQDYPDIAEPMVFDMVRPLGARAGELEVNTLAQTRLSGPDRVVEWAPEIELAVADGFAVELELPFEDGRVTDYKLGLQGTFGTLDGGKGVHGVQYLGVHNRDSGRWESSLLYLVGYRFNQRWSMMAMAGVGDVTFSGGDHHPRLLVNHSTFYDVSDASTLGLEFNLQTGHERRLLVMPQLHQSITAKLSLQAGIGAVHEQAVGWRPQAGLRVIREI